MKPSSVGENFTSVLELCSTCEDFIVCMSILLNLCMRVRVAFLITILPGQWDIRPTLRFSHEETFFNVHTGPPSLWPLSEKVKCSIHFSRIGGGGAIVPGLFHSTSPSTLNSIDVSFQSTLQYIFHLLKKKKNVQDVTRTRAACLKVEHLTYELFGTPTQYALNDCNTSAF